MPRKQCVPVSDGQITHFARRLRRSRESAGLTLRALATKSGYAASTLCSAESGYRRPSWDVVAAYVEACGEADLGRWRGWWDAADHEQAHDNRTDERAEEPVVVTIVQPRWWTTAAVAVAASALTVTVMVVFKRNNTTAMAA